MVKDPVILAALCFLATAFTVGGAAAHNTHNQASFARLRPVVKAWAVGDDDDSLQIVL